MVANNEKSTSIQHHLFAVARAKAWLIASLLLAIIIALWAQWPNISDPYVVQDDFRKFYWMHRYEDPGLFPDETRILSSIKHVDVGFADLYLDIRNPLYNVIFYLASPFFSINLASKLLIFPLILVSVYILYRIGASHGKPGTGFALATAFVVLNLSSPDTISVSSGLQRSFVAPILLVIVYSLMQKRYWIAAIAIAVGGLIYPPVMLLGLLVYLPSLFSLKVRPFRFKIYWRRTYPLLALAGLTVVLLVPALSLQITTINLDSLVTFDGLQRLLENPDYQADGRLPLFEPGFSPLVGRAGFFTRMELLWLSVVLALLSLAFLALRPSVWRDFPGPLKHLLWAGFMGYGLAWLGVVLTGAFALYLPNRYSRVSLFLALLAFLVMSVEKVMPNAIYRVKQLGKNAVWLPFLAAVGTCAAVLWIIQRDTGSWLSQIKGVRLTWNVALAAGILAGVFVLRLLSRGVPTDRLRWPGNSKIRKWHWLVLGVLALISSWSYVSRTEGRDMYLAIDDHSKNVMAFFESLPVDSRIMGHPCAMNSVAFLAKRSVLWSCKQPASGRPNVMDDTVKAYFGESLFGVFQFCQQHDVDYLYVDPKSFPKGNQYALLEVPSELKIYEDAGHFVIPCRPPPGEPDIPLELAQMEDAKLTWLAIDPALVQQGSNVDVHLFWEKLNPSAETLQLCLSLISEADDATVPECTSLITARDVRQLEGKAFGFMTYTLEVSPYLNRGNYQIFAEVVSSTDSSSESLTGVIGEIDFNATPRTFASQEDQGAANSIASWADQIALIDVNASNSENHTLEIDLSWRALERMSRSNKVFAHLVAKNGTGLIAQADAVPRNWAYPTNWWEKGEIVTDTLNIPIDGISPGSYQLWLGLYDEETLERLPLDGPTPSDDASYQDAIKIAELEL